MSLGECAWKGHRECTWEGKKNKCITKSVKENPWENVIEQIFLARLGSVFERVRESTLEGLFRQRQSIGKSDSVPKRDKESTLEGLLEQKESSDLFD